MSDREMTLNRPGLPLEAILWTCGLLALFILEPVSRGGLDLCLLHRFGIAHCPGCGLGESIHHLLHGDIAASWRAHPLGLPAVLLIGGRAGRLWYRFTTALVRHRKLEGETR